MREADEDGSAPAGSPPPDRAAMADSRENRDRITPADLVAFRRALDAATSRALVTPLIVLTCGVVFAAMIVSGVPILWPSAAQLTQWGANDGARVILRHEYWRLAASVFVHGGLIHLVANMSSLWVIGPLVERIYGHLAFAALYLAAGIGGAITSVAVPPVRVSVGASGAICGILGGLLAFLVVHRHAIPRTVLRELTRNALWVVLLMVLLGVVVSNIDQAAHIGGLATGFICGLVLIGPWPVAPGPRHWRMARRAAVTAVVAAVLSIAAVVVVRRGDSMIPPARRLDDLTEQLTPVIREFSAIRDDFSRSLGRVDATLPASDREKRLASIRDLRGRAVANMDRIRCVHTSHRELRAMAESFGRAVYAQIDRLEAVERYLETGDGAALDAAREALAKTIEATQECENLRLRYMSQYGLIPQDPGVIPRR
jgi:rhomboid protease GluP